jgi:hypothetical protein
MDKHDINSPPLYRLLLTLGRPFGLRWAGDNEAAVVYRLERYHELRGPGFFWINPLTQSVRLFIQVTPDFILINAPNVQTRDALQFEISIALAYKFNPDLMPADKAALFVTWSRNVHRAIVADNARRALQAVVPAFFSEQICRGEAFDAIEQKLKDELAGRLRPMAIELLLCMVQQVQVPTALQDRFEAVVQRGVNVQDLSQYEPYELTQAMRVEVVEALKTMSVGRQYINLPDLMDAAMPLPDQPPPRRIVRPVSMPDKSAPPQQEPPADTDIVTPKKRPKSRL